MGMHGSSFSGELADGIAVYKDMKGYPCPSTVWVRPAAGDTVTVSYSCDGGATYSAWPPGAVTGYTEETLVGPVTNLKFQRTAGSGTTSAYGVC